MKKMLVRVISAIGGGVVECDVPQNGTVKMLKNQVAAKKNIPPNTVLIVFRGRQLNDATTYEEAGIGDGDKVYLITRTEGGHG